jgi:Na+-transporting NADH:ubiquinone oxidoreductase subunit NqrB
VSETALSPVGLASGGGRSLRIAGRRYPVLLPRLADPRMHVAAVIVSVQVLGQAVLGFDVSIAQILLCIGVCALIEVPMTAWEKGVLAWPASALLTGNGTALILRTPGTEHGDWWSVRGWPIFVAAAAVSLLSKYAIRFRGHHVLNPSNFGLVVIFVVFGSAHADPQDLWWGDWGPALVVTLAVILVGGFSLARRLDLFSVALTFWGTFAAGVGVVAASGHAISARWSVDPVEGWQYWQVFVTSPEIIIFVFFMITDPRTAPAGRRARVAYAAATGVLAALLAAPQTTEFATKVSLLAALTLVCAAGPLVVLVGERAPSLRTAMRRPRPVLLAGGAVASLIVFVVALVVAGAPARGGRAAGGEVVGSAGGARPEVVLPAGSVPRVTVDPSVDDVAGAVDAAEAQGMGVDLAQDLAIEAQATRTLDAALASTASFGARLAGTEAAIATASDAGRPFELRHRLESLEVVLLRDPRSPQAIPQLGVTATGRRTVISYGDRDADEVASRAEEPFARTYLLTRHDGHHLIGDELAPTDPMVVGGG